MVTTFRPISGPIWRAATYPSSMAGSRRSPITGAVTPPSSSIPAPMSRSTSCSRIRATSRPQACMNHWASPRSIRPSASPSRSTSAAKPACPAFTPPATSPTPSCPRSPRQHRTARRRVSPPSSRCWFESTDWRMSMAVEPDSAGVRFPPPFLYLGALLLGLAAERFVTLRSFGIDWRLLVATGALLFVAGAAMMVAAAGHQRSAVAPNDPHRNDRPLSVDPQSHVSRHGAYLCRPCDRLRRADRLRLAPVGADRDPDAGDRPRGALSRSEVRRRLRPLQGRGSPLALTIPPLPPAGPSDKQRVRS